jgi:type II secretory pathway predicted ATPase ExeA
MTANSQDHVRIQSFFGFAKMPFTKYMWASKMFDSKSQRELLTGLHCWMDVRGLSVVIGPPGAGKSITLRSFREDIDKRSYQTYYFWNTRTRPLGFFRSLCRMLQITLRTCIADMFDEVSALLSSMEEMTGKHPLFIFDDCDNLSSELIEYLRLLSNFEMDSEDRFSIILSGSEILQSRLREPQNYPFRQRINFCHTLRPFTVDDARAYVDFHLKRAEGPHDIFTEGAVGLIFHMTRGYPRNINQVGLQSLIQAAIHRKEKIDENFIKRFVANNPLLEVGTEEQKPQA